MNASNKYRGVVFDLDGTLIDSASHLEFILNEMRRELNLEPLPLHLYQKWSSVGGLNLIANVFGTSIEQSATFLDAFRERYYNLITPKDSIFEGVEEALMYLSERDLKLAICSNKPQNLCIKILKELNLFNYFDAIVGGDQLPFKKPDARHLEYTAEIIAVDISQVLFVGDSLVDYETSINADATFILFEGGYGHGLDYEQCPLRLSSYAEFSKMI